MTLIKAGDAKAAQAHALIWDRLEPNLESASGHTDGPAPDARDEIIEDLRSQIEQLAGDIADRDEALKQLSDTLELTFAEGRAAGLEQGMASATSREADRVEAIRTAAAEAKAVLADAWTNAETLAVQLAIESLDKLVGDAGAHVDLLARSIRNQFSLLKDKAVLRVEVSEEDFATSDATGALAEAIGRPDIAVQALATLGPGECRMQLRLGTVEVGPAQQWKQLRQIIDDMLARDEAT